MDKTKLKEFIDSGLSDKQIAVEMNVSDRTVRSYKKKYNFQNQEIFSGTLCGFVDINGFSNYKIRNDGIIINNRNKIVKIMTTGRKYPYVDLFDNNKSNKKSVHILLAEHFISNPSNHPIVNHLDGNKTNYNISNLEWTTYSGNNKHAYDTGLKEATHGSRVTTSKLTEDIVENICTLIVSGCSSPQIKAQLSLNVACSTINKIRNKKLWLRISSKYF